MAHVKSVSSAKLLKGDTPEVVPSVVRQGEGGFCAAGFSSENQPHFAPILRKGEE